ncbi:TPA: AppA family phytase/histidine-type acid phosphatase [Citrobacter amalonaticus]|uniref:AppA family phytase/histidine-type acid phosphatase n=1 Tax=Citrobacter amalonaticus TaxID=35703 RepID=UPI0005C4B497|nr:AppA family phytase/histidine-type acid phosphatase [Citrobacter amalonaticus]MBJ9075067.1 AppA family phytase/histidine-type acid phosphatase [Citrobacter amalonaticus]QPB34106.1 AppA family phytase/histidine-type acid phosphatase [Citrobacter amalonaticus]HCC6165861.1 AppA family phytase/histidine-type acid phosphatase [Citrobacter amalonaticus]HCC6293442.1 AppA family phytase/histidine-type acid phosphatase [Citrobacter amalonaticus]HCC6430801.1 AppA family phytase/histidine-type acid ph
MNTLLFRLIMFIFMFGSFPLQAEVPDDMKLERVVIVSRHGVRAPTKFTPLMQEITPYHWPQWDVPLGWLTARGGELVTEMGRYQQKVLIDNGVLESNVCPSPEQVAVIADTDQRTRKTGEAFLAGFAPGCINKVHYQKDHDKKDPLFNPVKMGVCAFNVQKTQEAILTRAEGNIERYTQRYDSAFRTLEQVLNFSRSAACRSTSQSGCTLPGTLPSELRVSADNVALSGAWSLSSMLTEIFLLQEAQGMPEVAWGRIHGEKEWTALLSLHNAQFDLLQRTPEVARSRATPLLDLISEALVSDGSTENHYGIKLPDSLLFIAGHDTNLANLSGVFDLNWSLPGQPDNTPPGGELVFERWTRVSDNTDWIQISFVYQTLQQMREFIPFSSSSLPNKIVLTLPSCQDKNPEGMCPLKHFIDIVQTARIPQCAVMADVTR